MELKLKEGVDLSLLTTQHEIMTTTLGLLDLSMNHLDTELEMELMIGTVLNVVEGDLMTEMGNKEQKDLLNYIIQIIEPFYLNNIYTGPNKDILDRLLIQLKDYVYRQYNENNSIFGLLTKIIESFKNLGVDDIEALQNLIDNNMKKRDTEEKKETVEQVNGKLKDLIDKYQKKATN